MDCSDLQHVLYPFLDGEYGPEERVEIEDHLARCADCARLVHLESKFRETIRAKASSSHPHGTKASSGLRRRLIANLRQEHHRRVQQQVLRVGAVAVVALAAGGTYVIARMPSRHPYVEDAALRHARSLPMEVTGDGPEAVEAWFGGKLDHRVPVPKLGRAKLTGARLSNVKDRPAAYIRYSYDATSPSPRNVGLFVIGDTEGDLSAPAFPSIDLEQHRGYNVAIWRQGEIVYQLVSDLREEDIRQMVVSGESGSPGAVPRRPEPPLELDVRPATMRQ